ncbi:MAG: DUF1670 domain-containing protein, partial [Anaerolineales bacterium]|nr:DUF1670 domain-containing protein [Anaerolineales bacterium]
SGELLYYQAITAQLGLEWEKSRLYQHRLIELNRQANNFGGLAAALFNSAHVASFIGQHEEAILFAEELVQYVAANITEDDAYLLHVYRTMLLDCYTMGGQYEAAEKVVAQLLPWLTAEEEGRAAISGWSAVGTYHFYRQNLEASYYAHSRAITLAEKIGSASSSPFLCHAEVAALTNRLPEAQTSFSKATERIDLQHSGSNITFYYYVYYLLSRDVQHLNAARDNMLALVNHLHDPHLRHDYLHRMPLHADIAALWEAQAFTRVQVPLARLDAPLGRPLTNNDRIEVVWTVDAGELDTAVHQQSGKVAQRRCRLQRLAAEARAQGAAPTHADLAQALGVNVRTIERDSAALETAGTPLFTRRVQTKQAPE